LEKMTRQQRRAPVPPGGDPARVILLNKPFNVLCQFTDPDGRANLSDYLDIPRVYAAGRLDYDSEGLVLLTDSGPVQHRIADPRAKLPKTYWVQVEGVPSAEALRQLSEGVTLRDGVTRPALVSLMEAPEIWPRNPPIRERRLIPTAWLSVTLTEGKNRQVRRMTAAVGLPTLRLIRHSIGPWQLESLTPGQWREAGVPEAWLKKR
jgi:23S rRNA pseudouridine2457 synthase